MKDKIVIGICGMVRSGSTYQFNVVRKTLELNGYKVTFSKDDDTDEKLKLPTDIHSIKNSPSKWAKLIQKHSENH